ncbi:acyl-CoA thioesterase domain-containing protein [Glaciecola siphonariae]|uniref:Acyl-CoA thioesterase domain-containing protein n=1 Tax=Glaciecola siphonariae TaxID=521012 RepID=A0ABV9LUG1_9ALTE
MSDARLAHLFDLEPLEAGLYRGDSWDLGFRALYGGQVLGQSVMAAYKTVPEDRVIHSFHSYFLLPGDASKPVVYDVEDVRDGRSFSTRRVKAIQNGRNIFYMTASFQLPETGLTHQYAQMPEAPDAEDVTQDIQYYDDNIDKLSQRMKQALSYHRPVDIRTVGGAHSFRAVKREPKRTLWLRGRDKLDDSLAVNQASLAYASDYHFLSTALQAHGLAAQDKSLRMATIDHAMWFHKAFRFDDWLLYEMESPFSGNARALVQGKIFNKQGELVATSVQEGLMRQISEAD